MPNYRTFSALMELAWREAEELVLEEEGFITLSDVPPNRHGRIRGRIMRKVLKDLAIHADLFDQRFDSQRAPVAIPTAKIHHLPLPSFESGDGSMEEAASVVAG